MSAFNPSTELAKISQEVLRQTSDLFMVLDGKGTEFLYVNDSFSKVWEKNTEQLYEDGWEYFLKLVPKYRQTYLLKSIREVIYLQQPQVFDSEVILKETEEAFRFEIYPVQSKETPRIVLILRHVKYVYRNIIQDYEKREAQLVASKNAALESANHKTNFLSTMSHEIRTPLNAVIGITQLLLEENHSRDVYKNLKTLKFSADNLLVLINDILDFNKIEAGSVSFEEIHFDLHSVLKGIKHTFGLQANEKGIRLKLHYDDEIPLALIGDPIRLAQIITNLTSNAVKFTEEGAVRIFAELVSEDLQSAVIEFRVEDTGIGIPEDKQEIIFERFTQAGTDVSRKFGGTGLGLSITRKLLELQNSKIELKSKLNEGSQFFFTLKLPKGNVSEITYGKFRSEAGERNLQQARVLVAEDNAVNQLVVSQFLKKWNAQVDTATNGKEAVLKVQTNKFDLVLMDLQMPKMTGYEATEAIRSLPDKQYENIPIIALTAEALHDIQDRVSTAGMVDYVAKPFNASELYHKITKHLALNTTSINIPMMNHTNGLEASDKHLLNMAGILELSAGDDTVLHDFIELNRKGFGEFKTNYRNEMYSGELENLRKIVHKMKSTARFLHFQLLLDLMEYGKKLIISENRTSNDVESHLSEIDDLCDVAIHELEELITEPSK